MTINMAANKSTKKEYARNCYQSGNTAEYAK